MSHCPTCKDRCPTVRHAKTAVPLDLCPHCRHSCADSSVSSCRNKHELRSVVGQRGVVDPTRLRSVVGQRGVWISTGCGQSWDREVCGSPQSAVSGGTERCVDPHRLRSVVGQRSVWIPTGSQLTASLAVSAQTQRWTTAFYCTDNRESHTLR